MTLTFLIFALPLLALCISIAHEDHTTTYISVWKLQAMSVLALAAITFPPLPQTTHTAAIAGAGIGLILGVLLRALAKWRYKIDGFGGGDIWLFANGGALLGLTDMPAWIFLACASAVASTLFITWRDPEGVIEKPALPLGGFLCISLILIFALRGAGLSIPLLLP